MDFGVSINMAEVADILLKRAGFPFAVSVVNGQCPSDGTTLENSATRGVLVKVPLKDAGAGFIFDDGSVLLVFDIVVDDGTGIYDCKTIPCPDIYLAAVQAAEVKGADQDSSGMTFLEAEALYEEALVKARDKALMARNAATD